MLEFEHITDDIMRLKVPFENIYTAVFLIKTDEGAILVDAASGEHDVNNVILPALEAGGIKLSEIKYLFCTHLHGDHGGGIRHILPHLKNAKVAAMSERAVVLYGEENVRLVRDGEKLCGIEVVHLPGHSRDTAALLDKRTATLLSGDAVQLYGITRYGCGVGLPSEYRKSLARLCEMPIDMLVASHEYYPLGSLAKGNSVKAYLAEAISDFERITEFVKANKDMGDAAAIAKAFTENARLTEPNMPFLQSSTVKVLSEQ